MLATTGSTINIASLSEVLRKEISNLDYSVYFSTKDGQPYLSHQIPKDGEKILAVAPALNADGLGNPEFKQTYGLRFPLYSGAMANEISSAGMVIAMGEAGMMGSFGSGGVSHRRIEEAIQEVKSRLGQKPYAFNLLNSPNEPAMEQNAVDLFLKHQVRVIEASAYLTLTANLVRYRVSGYSIAPDGQPVIQNHVIAKLSRREVAKQFLSPAPAEMLARLLSEGKISEKQANLARTLPMADDVTVEADSGGHTDNRPLVVMLPAFLRQRNDFQAKYNYTKKVRIGAAGGIGTPAAALAAFMLGADYIVTGSINQACVEAGASEHSRKLLAQAEMTDTAMAPAGDMFEMGVKVQVLKRGSMFAMRAQKLYEIYSRYDSWDEVPDKEKERIESQILQHDFGSVWEACIQFFSQRDPRQIERAEKNPKDKMALVFRWYLGLSSRWSNTGEKGREMDYQIWCGPSIGSFNDWVKNTYLSEYSARRVVDVNLHILLGCAYLYRIQSLKAQGVLFPAELEQYLPAAPLS